MSSPVFTSDVFHTLKPTLDEVMTDSDADAMDGAMVMPRYFDETGMKDNYEDDLEVAGPGFASEKPEGQEMAVGSIREGLFVRYVARTIALRVLMTEEAIEDGKYEEAIDAAAFVRKAMRRSVDLDAALMLARGFNTSYVFGSGGKPLWSATQPLAQGGTYSNTMATPASPSRASMTILRAQARGLPGHDGIRAGYRITKILCTIEQESDWEGIVMSTHAPEAGQFNEINVVNQTMNLTKDDIVVVPLWDTTTTNYAVKTDADNGFRWKWRRRMRADSWKENAQQIQQFGMSMRYARGCSNPRASIGVNL